ncbi:MAG: hypothetical protein WDZ69_03135 [Candidatus Pacearchaeota archaeon]
MIKTKEFLPAILTVIIISFSLALFREIGLFLTILLAVFLAILINILAKKISAFYLDSEIEIKFWEIERYGFRPWMYFKKPVYLGAFLPVITSLLSVGNFVWMASLIFDVKPKTYRAAKRHGLYSFSEMTEDHIGLIASAGVLANLFFAIVGYLIGFSEFAKVNIYLAFFSMIPLSDLDGNKIFFGNLTLWTFLATLVLIGLGYALFII